MYIYLISLLLGALIYVTSQQQITNVNLFVGMQKFFFHASAWGRQYCQYFAGAPFARFCMLNCQERVGGGGAVGAVGGREGKKGQAGYKAGETHLSLGNTISHHILLCCFWFEFVNRAHFCIEG